jgi:AraC-like DNA-binding protein
MAGAWELVRRPPDARLRGLVADYVGFAERPAAPVERTELPGGRIPVIVHLEAPYRVSTPAGAVAPAAGFVAGLHQTAARTHTPAGGTACLQLDLAPAAAHRLLSVRMDELADRVVDLADLLGADAERLLEALREAPDWAQRFALLDAFLLRRLADARPPDGEVAWAWHALRRSGGRAPIAGLACELGWSHRRLIATFRREIGLPPKRVARILRFEHAVALARQPTAPGWAEIALEAGYADQAHLIRDFRAFAGTTPAAFAAAAAA